MSIYKYNFETMHLHLMSFCILARVLCYTSIFSAEKISLFGHLENY